MYSTYQNKGVHFQNKNNTKTHLYKTNQIKHIKTQKTNNNS